MKTPCLLRGDQTLSHLYQIGIITMFTSLKVKPMNQLIIKIADKQKAQMLLEMLKALDFVTSVETFEENDTITQKEEDFFNLAGLWKNRDVSAESIRQEAWKMEAES
jgi:phosphopantetheine adenylyltransferase